MRSALAVVLLPFGLIAADPMVSAFKARYETAKLNFIESAAAMPAAGMDFKLTPAQRSFGDWLSHTAGMNYNMCSSMTGKPAPANESAKAKSKPEIEKVLKESFVYCDEMFYSMTDAVATAPVTAGNRQVVPVDVMFGYIANLNAHYGNMVGYMRMKGITPPSTARSKK